MPKNSESFEISSKVRQDCLLSPLMFFVMLDWVTKKAYANSRKGIQWTLTSKLVELAFADDLALLSHRLQGMQEKGTIFSHRKCHKATWVSPDKLTENHIDHFMVSKRYSSSLENIKVKRGAKIGSDHHLVVTKIKMRLSAKKNLPKPRKKFNVGKLKQKTQRK